MMGSGRPAMRMSDTWHRNAPSGRLTADLHHLHYGGPRRRCSNHAQQKRIKASVQEDNKADLLNSIDQDQFAFKRPKFQAFIGQSEKGEQLKAFRHKARVPGGYLLIQPLGQRHLTVATDLLTESFADAVGYMPMYRGFLKKQVREYLSSHTNIAPKAVILEAIFLEEDAEAGLSDLEPDEYTKTVLSRTDDSISWLQHTLYPDDSSKEPSQPVSSPFQPSTPAALGETLMGSVDSILDQGSEPLSPYDEESDSTDKDDKALLESRTDRVTESCKNSEEQSVLPDAGSDDAEASIQSNENDDNSLEEQNSSNNTEEPSTSASTQLLEQAKDDVDLSEEQFIGTVELSFAASTRTKSLTLNPPEDGVYLCNMAVDENHKRKGYGMRMLAAAENLVEMAGSRRIWLHVRLKDEPALGLYSKAGYEIEEEDCILVGLWDDRRQLLSKFIPRRRSVDSQENSNGAKTEEGEKFVAEYWQ